MTAAVRADVFPAELVLDPDHEDPARRRRVYPVRVVVTLDEVLVFKDSGAGRRGAPELVFRDRLASYSPPVPPHRATKAQRADPSSRWAVLTTDRGHALSFARASGCGCGSRLKALSLAALLEAAEPEGAPPPSAPTAASVNDR